MHEFNEAASFIPPPFDDGSLPDVAIVRQADAAPDPSREWEPPIVASESRQPLPHESTAPERGEDVLAPLPAEAASVELSTDVLPEARVSPVQRLIGTTASDTTIQERHPDWPRVKLHLHFGQHGHAKNCYD